MNYKAESITAIILSGGKSSRMGRDKGLMMLRGKKMIEYVIDSALEITDNILIITNQAEYKALGFRTAEDMVKNCGPLGGIYTGLKISETATNIILSCDAPYINAGLLNYLITQNHSHEITVAEEGGIIHPLCGIYQKSCSGKMEMMLKSGRRKMKEVLSGFETNVVSINQQNKFYHPYLFKNVNQPSELEEAGKVSIQQTN